MKNNNASSHKSSGRRTKPITVELSDGRLIEAVHHFESENNRLMHLYIDEYPGGGIDVTVPLTEGDCVAYARSDVGREALGIDDDDAHLGPDTDDVTAVTDGGVDE